MCRFELDAGAPGEIQLTPAGLFRARDGRPEDLPGWYIDAEAAAQVIAAAARQRDRMVIDYEHQTLYARENGKPAPAAGWYRTLQWREGDGLYATDVEWTDAARAAIAAREYRYISPVISYDRRSGRVLAVLMAALTNYAAIDGMSDLAAVAAAHFSLPTDEPEKEDMMKREQLIALLGLGADAGDEQIGAALTALRAQAEELADLRRALAVADGDDAVAAVAALKADAGKPDPSRYVPIETMTELQQQVAALSARLTASEVDELVSEALDAGKLLPAQEAWARDLGAKDIEALKAYIASAQPIAALTGSQTGGQPPQGEGGDGALSDAELAVCKATGIDPEEFQKLKD